MARVYVYDSYDNKFFRYNLSENDPMPYSTGTTLRVREFRGSSKSNVLWTTTAAMEAWNLTRRTYGSGHSRWGTPSSGYGRAATAPPASTTQVSPLMSGSAAPPPSAARSTGPLFAAERGAM